MPIYGRTSTLYSTEHKYRFLYVYIPLDKQYTTVELYTTYLSILRFQVVLFVKSAMQVFVR